MTYVPFIKKHNFRLIYVCIHVLTIFNVSLHNDVSFFDLKAMFVLFMSVSMF